MTYSDLPSAIIRGIADALIHLSVQHNTEATTQARCRSLLIHMQQRHPNILQKAFQTVLNHTEVDKDIIEQLILSLSVQIPEPTNGTDIGGQIGEVDLLLATINADSTVRASAVRTLHDRLAKGDLGNLDLVSICRPRHSQ